MNQTIQDAFTTRYATKVFDTTKKIRQEDLETLIEVARMSPTAYGLQPFKIIHVQDERVRKEVQEASFGQAQVTDASDFFVVAYRTDIDSAFIDEYVKRISEARGIAVSELQGFADTMKGDIVSRSEEGKRTWAMRQSYIALGAMIESAALLGVDACPMEGFDPQKVDSILDLSKENLASVGYLALGYRGEDQYAGYKKVRLEQEDFVIKR